MRSTARKVLVAMMFAIAACGIFASTASAEQPTREILPTPQFPSLPDTICGFRIDVTAVRFNQVMTTFSNGTILITGSNVVRFTNFTTGKSVVSNQSGPLKIIPNGDGTYTVIAEGPAGVFFFPGELSTDSPGAFFYIRGRFTEQLTANFQPIPGTVQVTGNVQDFCAQLA